MSDTYSVKFSANDLTTAALIRSRFSEADVIEASHASGLEDAVTVVLGGLPTLVAIIAYLFERREPIKSIKITRNVTDTIEIECRGLSKAQIEKAINERIRKD